MIPDISFIVPIYNAKSYLHECVTSLIGQTHNEIEVLLVDDGSNDGSGDICDQFNKIDSRVRVFHINNSGVSVARNLGIEKSFGRWISFVDADDFLDPNFAKDMLLAAENSNSDIIVSNYILYTENKSIEQYFFPRCKQFEGDDIYKYLIIDSVLGSKTKTNIGVPWGKLYRRDFVTGGGISFKPGLKRMQDALFNVYAFNSADSVYFLDKCLYHYRQWKNSAVHRYTPEFEDICKTLIYEFKSFFMAIDYEDNYISVLDIKKVQLYYELLRVDICHEQNDSDLFYKIERIKTFSDSLPNIIPTIRKNFFYHLFRKVHIRNKNNLFSLLQKIIE